MTEPFNALYWDTGHPVSVQVAQLFRDLDSPARAAGGVERLLARDEVSARAVALEYFHAHAALGRFGEDNPVEPLSVEVAGVARRMLADAPVERDQEGALIRGANHASALLSLVTLVEPSDAALLARAPVWADPELRTLALLLATQVFDETIRPDRELLTVLARGAQDDSWPPDERGGALTALARGDAERAVELARRALGSSPLPLQASAALVLADHDLDASRAALERLVAGWPPDAPFPAAEVREILAD